MSRDGPEADTAERPPPRLVAKELRLTLSSPTRTVRFHGESMRPFLGEGDRVVVEPVAWEAIRVGDIITYRFEEKFPTRRVVAIGDDRLELWCDNWPRLRFEARREDVLGRAVARRRAGEAWLRSTDEAWKHRTRRALAAYRRERWRRFRRRVRQGLSRRARRVAAALGDHG